MGVRLNQMSLNRQYENIQQLLEHNKQEDILDVFISLLLNRLTTIYSLTNIVLCIWLAQTIFSSNLRSIPRSIYLVSPYFGQYPINDILTTQDKDCPQNYQLQTLKTFPTIYKSHISRKQMSNWKESKKFCVKRLDPNNIVNSTQEQCPYFNCNGYCLKDKSECPITHIQRLAPIQQAEENAQVFLEDQTGKYSYSKGKGRIIVGLMASYETHCASDYLFYDEFPHLDNYLIQALDCGSEGTILSFFSPFDHMNTSQFYYDNGVPLIVPKRLDTAQKIELGSVYEIQFNLQDYPECQETLKIAMQRDKYLFSNPVQPLMTKNLLVVSFFFLILHLMWLFTFYCCKCYSPSRHLIVVLLAVIELAIIIYIFQQNKSLFYTEQIVKEIGKCVENDLTAAKNWSFGIRSSSPFMMIIYVSVVFLMLFGTSFFIDRFVYGKQEQIGRHFQ